MEVFYGKGEILGERPVSAADPQDLASPAVRGQVSPAHGALAADHVDFSHHPPMEPGRVRRACHFAYEFMPRHSPEAAIAFEDLQIGAADARQPHPDQDFAGLGFRLGDVPEIQFVVQI
jgi:hypothetical protein